MIKITTLAIWITSNTRVEMPSIELNMHSCVGNGGFAARRLQTVITAWLADTSVPESRLSPHAEKNSYPKRSRVPHQLLAAGPVLVKHSPDLADLAQGSNVLTSILPFNTFFKDNKINPSLPPSLWQMHKTQSWDSIKYLNRQWESY